MANHILFDHNRETLLPFTFTRPVAEIRTGILTNREHWETLIGDRCSYMTEQYLSEKYPTWIEQENLYLNGAVLPTPSIVDAVHLLKLGQSLFSGELLIATFSGKKPGDISSGKVEFKGNVKVIARPWDIYENAESAIKDQFRLVTHGRRSIQASTTNTVLGARNVFIEDGARVECSIINAESGPVYIGRNAEIMEGCMIRGPFVMGDHSILKMGTKIYGPTVIGPHSRIGGEVNNSVVFGYSNKGHDGFLGNSVIGEWCNLGADTNNSNLKNNYSSVKVWSYAEQKMVDSGLIFCGLFMGDHSKCSINTMFNTGTVVGVCSNIFGSGFPKKFIPSFSWGGFEGSDRYDIEKAIELAGNVFQRRNRDFDTTEEKIVRHLFNLTGESEILNDA